MIRLQYVPELMKNEINSAKCQEYALLKIDSLCKTKQKQSWNMYLYLIDPQIWLLI